MKFFRGFREQSIPGKGIRKYMVYAIGEIFLVVIGILLAVTINNWNETRKEEARLQTYLKDYRNDLIIDTTAIGQNLKLLDLKKDAFKLALSDTFNSEHLDTTPMIYALILTYSPLKLQNKGYNELKNYATNNDAETDTLVQRIVAEHAAYSDLIETMIARVGKDIDDNMSYFKNNEQWIGDLVKNNITEDVRTYFISDDFINRAAIHYTLVYNNIYTVLKSYRDDYATKTLQSINARFKNATANSQETAITEEEATTTKNP